MANWYEGDKPTLDFSKPIIAEDESRGAKQTKQLLLPQIRTEQTHGYEVIGYNWFVLGSGEYGSCACFETVEEALAARRGYRIYNAEISVKELGQ